MSIISAITGSVVLLIRKINRIPRRIVLWLWIVPFIRMCLPVGVGGKYSLMSLLSKYAIKTVVVDVPMNKVDVPGDYFQYSIMNTIGVADSYNPITYKINILEDVFNVASMVWLVIAMALIIAFIWIYTITLKELSGAKRMKGNIYISDKIETPAVYGVLRPKIIIPTEYRNKDLTYVMMHENVHIKRKDNLWRVVAFAVTSFHWFNPLAWIFLKCFLEDLELSCDERVLAKCNQEQKKLYALTLLEGVESKSIFASALGGAGIRVRIENILSYKRMSMTALIGFAIFVVAVMYVLLTNAV